MLDFFKEALIAGLGALFGYIGRFTQDKLKKIAKIKKIRSEAIVRLKNCKKIFNRFEYIPAKAEFDIAAYLCQDYNLCKKRDVESFEKQINSIQDVLDTCINTEHYNEQFLVLIDRLINDVEK